MILKWAEERPDEVYLKQIINRHDGKEVADSTKLSVSIRRTRAQPGDRAAFTKKLCRVVYL